MVAQKAQPIMEYDVNEMTWIDHRQACTNDDATITDADATEDRKQALAVVCAQMDAPPYAPRLAAARELVDADAVTLGGAFEADTVTSGKKTYRIDDIDGCPCEDATHRSKWCKHALAAEIARRVSTRLLHATTMDTTPAEEPEAVNSEQCPVGSGQQKPSSLATSHKPRAADALPEAPASANAFVMIDGHRVQITVRGHALAGVLTELRTVLAQYPASAEATRDDVTPTPQKPTCPEHGPAKVKRSKFKGFYCAARDDAGEFCRWEVKD